MINNSKFYFKPKPEDIAKMYYDFFDVDIDEHELRAAILNGKTVRPGIFLRNNFSEDAWQGQQVFFIDVDNNNTIRTVKQNLEVCERLNIPPTIVYRTYTANYKNQKHRLVFVFSDLITDLKIRNSIQTHLTEIFAGDASTNSFEKMFFGGNAKYFFAEEQALDLERVSKAINTYSAESQIENVIG